MTLRSFRPVSAIVLVAIAAACATPLAPTDGGGSAPAPATASAVASVGPTPAVSVDPTSPPSPSAEAVEAVPSTEGVLNALWMGDGRLVAGGFAGPAFTSTIVVFDGTSWSVADVPVASGQVTGIAWFGDRLIAVGNGLPDRRVGFIWESPDGHAWRTVQEVEDAALYDVVAGDGVIVAAGARLDAEMQATATAWTSTDGLTWEQAEVANGAGSAMGSVALAPQGYAATGDRPLGEPRPLWVAADPASWAAQDDDLSDQLLPLDLVGWTDTLVLVGASGKSGDQHPVVALSTDGSHWEGTNLSTAEGYASAVGSGPDGLLVAGVDADRLTTWSMGDSAWAATTIEAMGASISALVWDETRGFVAVGARDGRHAVWELEGG